MRHDQLLNEQKPIILIETNDSLRQAVAHLMEYDVLAVDTEYDSFYRYKPRVCLVQISTSQQIYLIDTLAISDLLPLKKLFENPKIEKVLHDARQDILLLKKTLEFGLIHIFDTAIAARVMGTSQLGLKKLLYEELRITISKNERQVNWNKRPLPETMKQYAANDVRFLEDLRNKLRDDLIQADRYHEAKELFEWIETLEAKKRIFNPDSFLSLPKARELTQNELRILKSLYLWREKKAETTNRPAFMTIPDRMLITLAQQQPSNKSDLLTIFGKYKKIVQLYSSDLLEAIQRGKTLPHIDITQIKVTKKWLEQSTLLKHGRSRPSRKQIQRYNKLHQWRKNIAEQREVDSDVIVPKDVIQEISMENPSTLNELRIRPGFGTWRKQQYGEEILAALLDIKEISACGLCGAEFSDRELNVHCPFCTTRFHILEITQYLSTKPHCPKCNELLEI